MNNKESIKIKSFKDLLAWQESHKLVISVYEITKVFPKEEKFRLTDQLCRAVVSITSNIAEGFSRNYAKEKSQFYAMSLGSLTEIQNQLQVARDLKYIENKKFEELSKQIITANKLIHGLMKTVRDRNSNTV